MKSIKYPHVYSVKYQKRRYQKDTTARVKLTIKFIGYSKITIGKLIVQFTSKGRYHPIQIQLLFGQIQKKMGGSIPYPNVMICKIGSIKERFFKMAIGS